MNFHWFFICVASTLFISEHVYGQSEKTQQAQQILQVLFVGNSQFAGWDVPRMVQELSESASKDRPRLLCESWLKGGAWLQTHLDNPKTLPKLDSKKWDVVVLQEHYRAPTKTGRKKFIDAATTFHTEIGKRNAKTVFYASPNIESAGHEGFAAIHAVTIELAEKLDAHSAPAGAACLRVWKKKPQLDLHHKDRRHPNYKAAYIGACCLYAAITGKSPVGLTRICGKGSVSGEEALMFQTAAWEQHQETNVGDTR